MTCLKAASKDAIDVSKVEKSENGAVQRQVKNDSARWMGSPGDAKDFENQPGYEMACHDALGMQKTGQYWCPNRRE